MSSTNQDLETVKKNKITELFNAYNKESSALATFYNQQINAINNSTNTDKNKKFLMSKIISECSYRNNLLQTKLNEQIARINLDEEIDISNLADENQEKENKTIVLDSIETTSVGDLEVFDKLSQKVNNLIKSYNDKINNYNKKINDYNNNITNYLNELIDIDKNYEESLGLIEKYTQLVKKHTDDIAIMDIKRSTHKKTIDEHSDKIVEYNKRIDILKKKLDNSVLIVEDVDLSDELNLIVQENKGMNDYVLYSNDKSINTSGTKKALLCGLAYSNTTHKLKSSIVNNNIIDMKNLLSKYEYSSENIKTLFDYELQTITKDLFINEFSNFIDSGVAGDTLFFYYNGHGTYTTNVNNDGLDDRDEAIITGDSKYIIYDDFRTIIRNNLKKDVNLVIIFDCCFKNTFLDLKYEYLDFTRNNYNTINPKYQETAGNVIMISGVSNNKNLSNTNYDEVRVSGGLSLALKIAISETENVSWYQLINKLRKILSGSIFAMTPQFSSGKQLNINSKFSL